MENLKELIEQKELEIESLESEISDLTIEIDDLKTQLEETDIHKDEVLTAAKAVKVIYDAYLEVGFTEKQAFMLAHTFVENSTKPKSLF